mmetsp:Transcript_12650/g.45503  ORF Transcript_12650/g.45503 Transcript_12650/m.45503 type:complete len:261 (+) Transcript_12650:1278-2060(+)|eukprot:30017-Pelagococcus_subviridis.AAC.29
MSTVSERHQMSSPKFASMSRTHSPTDAPAAIFSLNFRTHASCRRNSVIVFNTAHRTSLSLFFCVNASARNIPSSCRTSDTPPSLNPKAMYSMLIPASATQLNRPKLPLPIFPRATSLWNAPSQNAHPAWTFSAPYFSYASRDDSVYPFGRIPMRYATRKCAASCIRRRALYSVDVVCARVSNTSASTPPPNPIWSTTSAPAATDAAAASVEPLGCAAKIHPPTTSASALETASRRFDIVLSVGDSSLSASMPLSFSSLSA